MRPVLFIGPFVSMCLAQHSGFPLPHSIGEFLAAFHPRLLWGHAMFAQMRPALLIVPYVLKI